MYRDRFRTLINVWGDSIGAGVVAHLSRDLQEVEEDNLDDSMQKKSINFLNNMDHEEHGVDTFHEKEIAKSVTSTSSQTATLNRGYVVDETFPRNETTF